MCLPVLHRSLLPWMNNQTMLVPLQQPIVFEIEGFDILPGSGPFFFLLALLVYMLVLLGNGVVVCVIILDKKLHRPMFVMICHLVVCDLMGATAVLPHLMMDFLMGQKKIIYPAAISQAFCTIFGIFPSTQWCVCRYVAVCEPLRYHTIMTSARLHFCCALAWIVALVLIALLFSSHMNAPLCGYLWFYIINIDSSHFLELSVVFIIIAFSYIRILTDSYKQCRTDSKRSVGSALVRSKAFQTCAPHLVIYTLYQIASVIIIVGYRFPSVHPNLIKFFSILFIIIPPAINPVIYGLIQHTVLWGLDDPTPNVKVPRIAQLIHFV
uniref:G-protein coupled receptors family 1 profile domain-containing protein n=1 Tax=Oryzias latipes TaxID=8090 RepID=A0A3B3HGH7_ORYLA